MSWNFRIKAGDRDGHAAKHPVQIMQEAAAVISVGGAYQNYITQKTDGSPDMEEISEMVSVSEFVNARKPYCFRGTPIHQAALLLSTYDRSFEATRLYSRTGFEKVMGLTALLCDVGQSLEIVCEHTLEKEYKDYKIIVVPELYKGHEVSCHMYTHPQAPYIPERSIMEEMRLDKDALEKACGYIVRGMSYPYGKFNERVADVLRMTGMEYSRTTRKTLSFMLPEDFLLWHPTCHHRENISELADKFLASDGSRWKDLDVFYVWGHSYEFNDNDNWEIIENFCEKVSNKDFVWYATNIEIVDYVNALRAVRMSQSLDMAYNPTATDVWFWVNGETVKIPAGETVKLV
jgi:peptidoglycan/xylan/chitin deacetylase (PgdA/CDA1 family)